jgi:hypothetical protein
LRSLPRSTRPCLRRPPITVAHTDEVSEAGSNDHIVGAVPCIPGGEPVNADRKIRLWTWIVDQSNGGPVEVRHVCAAVVVAAGVDGVAVTVVRSAMVPETVYASDQTAARLEELASTLGEGPGLDAFTSRGPVLIADVAALDLRARWPVFAAAAAGAGARALFALPMHIGAIELGVLNLYRAMPGGLGSEQLADVLALADTACLLLLDGADRVASYLAGRGPPPEQADQHPQVHQATGMVIAQLGVSATVALVRLRAYAYAHDRRLRDVANDVVTRRLCFEPEPAGDHEADP